MAQNVTAAGDVSVKAKLPDIFPHKIFSVKKVLHKTPGTDREAMRLRNDGHHLYLGNLNQGGEWYHVPFQYLEKSNKFFSKLFGKFLEDDIAVKNFGHTRTGSVIIDIRQRAGNWGIVFAIYLRQVIQVLDSPGQVDVYYLNNL